MTGRRERQTFAATVEFFPGRRLVLVAVLVCTLLTSAGGVFAVLSYQDARSGVVSSIEMRGRIAAAEAYGQRISLVRLLQALASDPALRRGDVTAYRDRLHSVGGEAFGFTGGLSWIDTDGIVRASTRGTEGEPAGGRWWQEVLSTGQWTTSEALASPAFAGQVTVFAVPTVDGSDVVNGILAAGWGVDWQRSSVQSQVKRFGTGRYGSHTDLLILNRSGQLLVGPGVEATRDVSTSATYRLIMVRQLRSQYGTLIDVPGVTGQPGRVVTFARTGSFGEIVVLERGIVDAFAVPRRLLFERLITIVVLALLAVTGAVLVGRRLDRQTRQRTEQHRAEHAVVVDLQRSLLASRLPAGASARYLPAGSVLNVGGDWYDVIQLPRDRLLLVVGDVVGHGVPAALAMGQVRTATRALAGRLAGPAELLSELDRYVSSMEEIVFCTAVCAVVDPVAGELRYAAAGHPPSLLRRADGTVRVLEDAHGAPLGLTTTDRVETRLPLPPDTLLVLYTDGLVERRDEPIDTGIDRLAAAVAGHDPADEDWCDHVITETLAGSPQFDDIVLLSFRPATAAVPVQRTNARVPR